MFGVVIVVVIVIWSAIVIWTDFGIWISELDCDCDSEWDGGYDWCGL